MVWEVEFLVKTGYSWFGSGYKEAREESWLEGSGLELSVMMAS